MDDLTVSIATIDRFDMLEKCLSSIYGGENSQLRFKVFVVFNGPAAPAATQKIAELFPQVEFISYPGSLGYCRVHNLVMERAQSKYVLVLDDDTVLSKNTLSTMVGFMDAHPDVGIAGCRTLHPDGSFQKTFGLMHSLKTELTNTLGISTYWPDWLYKDTSSVRDVEWLNGSFLFVRSEVLARVGLLDEHFYTYSCESDWCYRIKKAGFRVVYLTHTEIIHACGHHSIYTSSRKYSSIVRAYVNRYYFFHKHYGSAAYTLLRPIIVLGSLLRILRYSLVYVFQPPIRDAAKVRIKAFLRIIGISLSPRAYEPPDDLKSQQTVPPAIKG
jgi:GT2 family glycosyltransferase